MMNTEIKVSRQPDGRYIVTVDGGSKECATWSEALSIVESEGGMPLAKAHRELFEKCKAVEADLANLTAAMVEMTADRDKYKNWWYKLYCENARMRDAICAAYIKEYCA